MICTNCGTQNIDGVTFCGSCGAKMETRIQQETPVQSQQDGRLPPQNTPPGGLYTPPPPPPPQGSFQQYSGNPYSQQQPSGGQYSQPYGNQYSQPYGGPSNGGMVPPKNYMVESIIVTVVSVLCCCCSPISIVLGIIAIIKANNVNTSFERGDINEAISNSESAKNLSMWAAIITVVFVIMIIIGYVIWGAAILGAAGGFPY